MEKQNETFGSRQDDERPSDGITRGEESGSEGPAQGRNLRKRRQYFCSECEECFTGSRELESHRRVHSGERSHERDIRRDSFTSTSKLSNHSSEPSASETPPTDPVADSPWPDDKPHQCKYCDKCFRDKSILEIHERVHTGKLAFPCTMCEESFSKPSVLVEHIIAHGDKPFHCNQCSKKFNDHSLLVVHQRTHEDEVPQKCERCNKWFPDQRSLDAHGDCQLQPKPYKCRHCVKRFNSQSLLIIHEGVHTDSKPFQCTECSEGFYLKKQLDSHQVIHAPKKPFPCSRCDKSFNKEETLHIHMHVHNAK
ncbi:gastrula zinc finger protein xLCGF3.1-like [Spea bombifrons]|uniref:gastrula zinc finger protein xLCGF3.1-like n=1 Tax=Spea bombifrons TaxID=233779 RepID=UPI00234BF1AF|nr:gastrula zinc finger protein xLCGF3.1-like [Spea bombifrons]